MRRIRIGATLIGIMFGLIYGAFGVFAMLVNSIGGGISYQAHGFAGLRFQYLLLLFSPFSLIAATMVAWKYERIAGWWLTIGAVTVAILSRFLVSPEVAGMSAASAAAVCSLPMLVAGSLWLLDAARVARRMQS